MIQETDSKIEAFEPLAQVFKTLTHPARIAILEILRDGEHCVCHMETFLGLRQAYISQQLAVLREAGIIQDRREGWNIFYRVVDPRIFDLMDAVSKMTGQTFPILSQADVECSCPHCSSNNS